MFLLCRRPVCKVGGYGWRECSVFRHLGTKCHIPTQRPLCIFTGVLLDRCDDGPAVGATPLRSPRHQKSFDGLVQLVRNRNDGNDQHLMSKAETSCFAPPRIFLSPLNLASQGAVMGLAPPHLVGGWAACHRCFSLFIFCLLLYCFAESSNPRNDFGPEPFAGSRVKGLPLTATRGNSMRIYEDFVARKACGRMLLPLLCL